MKFTKTRAPIRQPPSTPDVTSDAPSNIDIPVRWSDIVAARKSTHPDAAPIYRLLNTTELLEQVLSYLPVKDLLITQRVCRRMRDVVQTSSPLQTNLFFRALKDQNAQPWVINSEDILYTGNEARDHLQKAATSINELFDFQPTICNPHVLFKQISDVFGFGNRLDNFCQHRTTPWEYFELWHTEVPAEASCRSMFLTQPPVATVDVEIEGKKDFLPWEDRRGLRKWYYGTIAKVRVENPEGVTLGDVLKTERREGWIENIIFPDSFVVTAEVKRLVEGR